MQRMKLNIITNVANVGIVLTLSELDNHMGTHYKENEATHGGVDQQDNLSEQDPGNAETQQSVEKETNYVNKYSQTNLSCIQCDVKNVDNNCLQKYIDDMKLKTEQAEKHMQEELLKGKKEMDKMKREKGKIEKDHEAELKEIKEQLSRSFAEVKQFVEANVKRNFDRNSQS